MTPFLQQVANLFYTTYGDDVQRMAFIFPNRRAGLFFRKYLSHVADHPLFSPAILTINGLFEQLCALQPADHLQMLFLLYHIYIKRSGGREAFDDFVHWGEMLLADFDDVDKYLVDARQLFTNASHLHEFEKDLSYLAPDQVEAIRSFWASFRPDTESDDNRRSFLGVWDILHDVYCDLRAELAERGRGYEGMIARDVVERIRRDEGAELPYTHVIFVGLNALTRAEEVLLEELQKQGIADFYWDGGTMTADPDAGGFHRVLDKDNRASHFLRNYIHRFPSAHDLPPEEPNAPEIVLPGLPSRIGQAKHVHELLLRMAEGRDRMDEDEALRTAVVLPDERLLLPVLNAIPHAISHINITLGYPLTDTPVASLMKDVLALQKNLRTAPGGGVECYHREVTAILNHRYIRRAEPTVVATLLSHITANNRIYIPAADLVQTDLLQLIFRRVTSAADLSRYLIDLLKGLNGLFPEGDVDKAVDNADPVGMDAIEREFTHTYYTTLTRMNDLIAEAEITMTIDTYTRLLSRLLETVAIPFRGEPLAGLQIMGVLETRVLDFDRLIILSMNEGLFPARGAAPSFIPYTLRHGFGLPTFEHRDSVFAYHFYRMISRARSVTLLYDTRTDGFRTTGEVSRFVHQLRYHYETPIVEQAPSFAITSSDPLALRVEKTGQVLDALNAYLQPGGHKLSASTINNYIDCPMRFCLATVLRLKEEEEVTENVEHRLFGSILHRVMEDIYKPLCGATVTKDYLGGLMARRDAIKQHVARAFAELFFHTPDDVRPLVGQNRLTGEVIEKYVLQILRYDQRMADSFIYVGSEQRVASSFPLTDGRRANLIGYIDRLDEVDGALRIVDYKTGIKKDLRFESVTDLFDRNKGNTRKAAVMQVLTYGWMVHTEGLTRSLPLRPSIYYVRDLFADDFDPSIYLGKSRAKKENCLLIDDFVAQQLPAFESALRDTLDEIFDPRIPFIQTDRSDQCNYCDFRDICGRKKSE